jgi:hypothetical protein
MTTHPTRKWFYPIDRTAIVILLVLSLVISFFVWKGDRTPPRIRDFSWRDRQVGMEDTAFILNFSRPMDHASVENNLQIKPPLAGKFSWAGRRMAYTLDAPAPYGEKFELQLQGSRDRFSDPDDTRALMPLYQAAFKTRDRAFVYLGAEGEEEGRLVLQNLTQQQRAVLTPANLTVMDFKPYPEGDRILFSASDRNTPGNALLNQKIYTVTTGIQLQDAATGPKVDQSQSSASNTPAQPAGVINLVLDSQDYQNLKFDLSPNGKTIIVQRVNQKNPSDSGIWMIKAGAAPQPIKTEPGGDFQIAPDSASLAMSQGQGMAILPLEQEAERLDFLPKFGVVLDFANDGSAAAMVKFNRDPNNPTRSLFLVTNQGTEKELLVTDGSVLDAQFDPMKENLYCLVTQRLPGKDYVEEPYLVSINLKTAQRVDLLRLPIQRDIQMSLAPDSLGILFDQVVAEQPTPKPSTSTPKSSKQAPAKPSSTPSATNPPSPPPAPPASPAASPKPSPNAAQPNSTDNALRTSEGKAIATSRLWFLPTPLDPNTQMTLPAQPQSLEIAGLRPRWLP